MPGRDESLNIILRSVTYCPGDRVRIVDLDVAGRVVDIIDGEPPLVIVDVHDSPDRLTVTPSGLEHLD